MPEENIYLLIIVMQSTINDYFYCQLISDDLIIFRYINKCVMCHLILNDYGVNVLE